MWSLKLYILDFLIFKLKFIVLAKRFLEIYEKCNKVQYSPFYYLILHAE
jgi:hypothetical protein